MNARVTTAGAIAGAAASAIAIAVLIGGSGPTPSRGAAGADLQIVLFQPPEPEIPLGSVMDVGPVVDGYVHRPPAPPSPAYLEAAWLYEEPEYLSPGPSDAPHSQADVSRITVYTSSPTPNPVGRPEAFGFDEPQPDYAAARREREVQLDRRMAERRARDEALKGNGPQPYADYQAEDAFF